MKKRILSIFMVLAMLCTSLPFSALNVVAETSGDFEYTILEDGTAEITDYTGSDTEIVIPSELDGYKVTSIGKAAFAWSENLINVVIPESISQIGKRAFYSCYDLTNINVSEKNKDFSSIDGILFNKDKTKLIQYPCNKISNNYIIPDGVTKIEGYAFSDCMNLKDIEIPDSVIEIGEYAFAWCYSLKNVKIPNYVTKIGDFAFYYCYNITDVIIPDSVTKIGKCAFYSCFDLTNINVSEKNKNYTSIDGVLFIKDKTRLMQYPCNKMGENYIIHNGVTEIEQYAFADCKNLKNVEIPDSVIEIGEYAFSSCTNLTNVEIPDSVIKVGESAFYSCDYLTSIEVSENNKNYSSVGGVLFNKDKTKLIQYPSDKIDENYIIPNSVMEIGEYAFYNCEYLKNVEIPDSVIKIEDCAFEFCNLLNSINIPNSVEYIGYGAFMECDSLTDIYYDGSKNQLQCICLDELSEITIHFENELYDDSGFGYIVQNEKVTITSYNGDDNEIVIPSQIGGYDVAFIGVAAFYENYNITNVFIPDSVIKIGGNAFEWCFDLISIEVSEKNKNYSSIDGVLFNKDKTKLIKYPYNKMDENYIVPNSVEVIGRNAFEVCYNLKNVEISDSVTEIEENAFYCCDELTNVILSDSLVKIGENAFYSCYSLTQVIIPNSVIEIGGYAFAWCESLADITISNNLIEIGENVFYGCYDLKEVIIPSSVTKIGEYAFCECINLIKIEIPNSVTDIEECAFGLCEELEDVYYKGTEEDWNSIDIGAENDELLLATIHFNQSMSVDKYFELKEATDLTISMNNQINKKVLIGVSVDASQTNILSNFINSENMQMVDKDGDILVADAKVGTGAKIQLLENGNVKDELVIVIKGEINGDAKIDAKDVTMQRREIAGGWRTSVIELSADLDENEKLEAKDVTILRRYVAGGWNVTF